jgi:hypothetical protein
MGTNTYTGGIQSLFGHQLMTTVVTNNAVEAEYTAKLTRQDPHVGAPNTLHTPRLSPVSRLC